MEKPATIYSIARDVGVHASTVSRAFSRPELVRAEIRERILARADEVRYRPNAVARGLTTGRTNMVGVLVPDIENPFFAPLVRAVQTSLAGHGQPILLMDSDLTAAAEVGLIERVRSQIDGLLVVSPRSAPGALVAASRPLPMVLVNRESKDCPSITIDAGPATIEAADALIADGHRRFALLRGPQTSWSAGVRLRTMRAWARARHVALLEFGPSEANFEGGLEAADPVAGSEATAVLAFDDLMAIGVLAGLTRLGLRVPADVSIIGCDDVLLSRVVSPQLTTVSVPFAELGTVVADLLARQAAGEDVPGQVVLTGRLVTRESTGPATVRP